MKVLSLAVCALLWFLMAGSAFASDNEELLPLFKKMVAEDKTRFGIDIKKCRLECGRVYSASHCISKCDEIAGRLRAEGLEKERVEREQLEAEKPIKYKEVAEKYK